MCRGGTHGICTGHLRSAVLTKFCSEQLKEPDESAARMSCGLLLHCSPKLPPERQTGQQNGSSGLRGPVAKSC